MTYTTHTPKETKDAAKEFAVSLQGGGVVALEGGLGAGKTTFVQGVAEAFGITDPVRSPTFSLVNIHKIPNHSLIKFLIHADLYRLENVDPAEVGLDEWMGRKDAVVFIEWSDRSQELFPTHTVSMQSESGGRHRIIVKETTP